jgi:archaeosine synthase beta-subunit
VDSTLDSSGTILDSSGTTSDSPGTILDSARTNIDGRIRSLRPPKAHVDPYAAHGSLLEDERRPGGKIEQALTVFLTGAECPFTCSFCDLWQWTLDGPTPPGALTRQLESVLEARDGQSREGQAARDQTSRGRAPDRLKLYNASNFFDKRAVPSEDLLGIARLASPFAAITVESHANTIGAKTLEFARQISGRLEVAVGLETIHPTAAAHLNKRLDLTRFDSATRFLSDNDIDLRVFVLLGAPYVPVDETVAWTVRTVEYAVGRGASLVSIIPVRGGNGELERLQGLGHFTPPTLLQLEESLDLSLQFTRAVVTADLWDVDRLPACEHCRAGRVERLQRVNLSGRAESRVSCGACGAK